MSYYNIELLPEYSAAISDDLRGLTEPAAIRLLERHNRKFVAVDVDDNSRSDEALKKFRLDLERVSSFELQLTPVEIGDMKEFITRTLDSGSVALVRDYGFSTFYDDSDDAFFCDLYTNADLLNFGKGKSNGSEHTHILDKLNYGSPTFTRGLCPYIQHFSKVDGPLGRAIKGMLSSGRLEMIEGSKIITVPKNDRIDRVIALEPTVNLWLQLALGKFIEISLSSVGLNIKNQQDKNKNLARIGSLQSQVLNNPFCTLDLSSASDSISLELLRQILPSKLYDQICCLRSEVASINNESYEKLPMVSTMGNGFTFPLLTLVCAAMCYAANPTAKSGHLNWRETAVFGDDCIVRKNCYSRTVSMFERSGFIINSDKSYSIGSFRESCGGDYDDGVFITPVYVTSLETAEEITIAINRISQWSAIHGIPMLSTLTMLKKYLDPSYHATPLALGATAGIVLPRMGVFQGSTRVTVRNRVVKKKVDEQRSVDVRIFGYLCGYLSRLSDTALEPKYLKKINTQTFTQPFGKSGLSRDDCYTTRECTFIMKNKRIYYPFPWDSVEKHPPIERVEDFWIVHTGKLFAYELTTLQKLRWCICAEFVLGQALADEVDLKSLT